MDLKCNIFPGWIPWLRAAPQERQWMEESQDKFAYRCLPLSIANAHGWELLCPTSFHVIWQGGRRPNDVIVYPHDPNVDRRFLPVAIFGEQMLTFHVDGIFRTPPEFNLYVTGSPNSPKEGIYPLTGIIETDWAPMTFTMNWRVLRRNHPITFEKGEPFCFFFPVSKSDITKFDPQIVPVENDPDLMEQYKLWEQSRNAFHLKQKTDPAKHKQDSWQKDYMVGRDMRGKTAEHHIRKLRLPEFRKASGGGP